MGLLLAAVASGTAPASSLLCHVGEVEVEEGPFLMEGKGVDLDAELNVQCTWSTLMRMPSWSKLVAPSNIACVWVALLRSHLSIGWLNFVAPLNISPKF